MNCSAETARRKWPSSAHPRGTPSMVTAIMAVFVVVLGLDASPAAARRSHHPDLFGDLFGGGPVRLRGSVHAPKRAHEPKQDSKQTQEPKEPHETREANDSKVPLPQPRPAEAPKVEPDKPATAKAAPADKSKLANQAATATPTPVPTPEGPPPPSACRLALTEQIAIAPSVPDIHGPGGCGGEDLVRLESIVLPDKHRVSMKPAATMRCGMAAAVADWVRTDVQPLAQGMGTEVTELENYDAYECRGRNGVSGAPLSEHGHANAIDVHAFKLANGQSFGLTDRNVPRAARESVLSSVCTRFTTVLGPGSDGYHEDHIHLDLLQRHNNYKICQWNVWDPLPQIAPLMPEVRPGDAPPRQVADQEDGSKASERKGNDGKTTAAPSGPAESESAGDKSDDANEAKSNRGKSNRAKSNASKSQSSKSESSNSEKDQSATSKPKSSKQKSGMPDKSEPDDEAATKKRRHDRRS
jgi:hypothetical protein